jgi:hypothetical protein
MSTLLDNLAIDAGNSAYHGEDFLLYIRSHLLYLKDYSVPVPLDKGLVYKFEYNLYSLLVEMKYAFEDFPIIMIVNGFTSPEEMTRDFTTMLIPDPQVVAQLKTLFLSKTSRV